MTTRVDVYTVEGQCGLTVVGQPVVCEELAITLFMRGYLPVMGTIKPALKPIMAKHLKELMADANVYWWSLVTAYHAVWPQQIENAMPSGVTPTPSGSSGGHWCGIHPLRLLGPSQQWQGALRRRTPRQAAYTTIVVKPSTEACSAFQQGRLHSQEDHLMELHICTFCLSSVNRQCAHPERFCHRNQCTATKTEGGGGCCSPVSAPYGHG